jgi:hypothetical protein
MIMDRTRERLARDKTARQLAVASFPVRCAQMADDMRKLIEAHIQAGFSQSTQDTIDYIENRIRQEYRELFGCELGEHADK